MNDPLVTELREPDLSADVVNFGRLTAKALADLFVPKILLALCDEVERWHATYLVENELRLTAESATAVREQRLRAALEQVVQRLKLAAIVTDTWEEMERVLTDTCQIASRALAGDALPAAQEQNDGGSSR